MKYVLIACEESQTICKAFRQYGCAAYSCDLQKCSGGRPEWHILGDAEIVVEGCAAYTLETGEQVIIPNRWDLIIAHPPCTFLTHSSAVALSQGKHTMSQVEEAARFFMKMLNAPANCVAVENPAPLKICGLPKYSQTIQPYNFGHIYSKRVCLWLKNLPPLLPTHGMVINHIPWLGHCSSRSKRRSKTFEGIAQAMALQWHDSI